MRVRVRVGLGFGVSVRCGVGVGVRVRVRVTARSEPAGRMRVWAARRLSGPNHGAPIGEIPGRYRGDIGEI